MFTDNDLEEAIMKTWFAILLTPAAICGLAVLVAVSGIVLFGAP